MKTPSLSASRLLAFLILLFAALPSLFAQAPPSGTITGRVYEGATGRSLQGAIVKVLDTTVVDVTNAEGRFSLQGVPAGSHIVEVDYVGLEPFKQNVAVATGTTLLLNAELKSDVLKMQAFEVAESARGQALAINQQKTARGIVNIVSEETFAAMNDGNIGYALQKLPGLTVNEAEEDRKSVV